MHANGKVCARALDISHAADTTDSDASHTGKEKIEDLSNY